MSAPPVLAPTVGTRIRARARHAGELLGRLLPAMLLTASLLPACTYLEEKRDLLSGGPQQREAAAQAQLDAERQRSAGLQRQQSQRQADLDAVDRRLAAAQVRLDAQQRRLDAALKARKIGEAKYRDLKRQTEQLKADTAQLQQSRPPTLTRSVANVDDTAKLQQLERLEQRRRDLEAALQAAVGK